MDDKPNDTWLEMQERKAMTEQWLDRKDWMTGKLPEPVLTIVDEEDRHPGGSIVWTVILMVLAIGAIITWLFYFK